VIDILLVQSYKWSKLFSACGWKRKRCAGS